MLYLTGHSGQVTALAFSPDGRWLASAGWDGSVRLWERPAYQQARCMRTPYDHAMTVAFSPHGNRLAMGFRNHDGSPDRRGFGHFAWTTVRPAPGRNPETLPIQDTWYAFSRSTRIVSVHPSGQKVAIYGEPNLFQIVDPVERTHLKSLAISPSSSTFDMTYSPDGTVIAAVTNIDPQAGAVYVWEDASRDPSVMPVKQDAGRAISFSPDGRELYVGFASGRLIWWHMDAAGPPAMATPSESPIIDIVFAPDGRSLLLAGEDGQIRLWDVKGRLVRESYDWHIGSIQCVAFAPDGLTAAAGGDGVVLVWDIDT